LAAGITLAAYALPVSLAYATLAGLPPQAGIFGFLLGGLAYALPGACGQLAIGPTSAISMLVGATIAPLAQGDAARWAAIASLTAGLVAIICFVAWVLRLSSLVNFIGETILTGFKAGAAITIAVSQLPKLLGVPGGSGHFLTQCGALIEQAADTNMVVLGLGLAAIALLMLGEAFLPGRPVAVFVVALAIAAMIWLPLRSMGVDSVSAIPSALPSFQTPSLRARDIDGVVALGFACFLLSYIEGISAAKAISKRHGKVVDGRQELLALGGANLFLAFGQGYPAAGGFSQSAVNDNAGAKTPMALIICSAALSLFVLYFASVLPDLPKLILAAIVIVAVKGLVNITELRRLWRLSRMEFWVAMVALSGVLLLGILRGVLLAALISLLVLLAGTSRPAIAILGRIRSTQRYSELSRHPDAGEIAGFLVFRVEAAILYFNAEHIRETVRREAGARAAHFVVCDLSSTPHLDVAGATMLFELSQELQRAGRSLRLAEARGRIRELLQNAGFDELLGRLDRQQSVDHVVQAALTEGGTSER
jgi:high affinity sulfate transporter 1